jgi:site-specific DNA-methyltransferase (adenine-specific)
MTTDFQNTLYTQDNLFVLYGLNSDLVDLIYLDPPFNSKRMYSAPVGSKAAGSSFKDMWEWKDINEAYLEKLTEKYPALSKFITTIGSLHSKEMMAYVTYMTQRIIELHRILKSTGSLYLHCDPTASHYLKLVLDEVFGKNNFRNEIIWCYSNSGRSKKKFASKHDVILFYSKSESYHYEYRQEISEKYLESHYNQTDSEGRKCRIRTDHGKQRIYYPEEGVTANDWWEDIPSLNSQAKERTGYPTQKPLALLNRIIEASSKVGDIVLDPFCGCATTCVASEKLQRKWIGIDIEENAVKVLMKRFEDELGSLITNYIHLKKPPKRTDVEEIDVSNKTVKERLFKEQEGCCNGCRTNFEIRNFEVDHIVPKAKGGGDYYENYQLLCSACNRVKGARPMDYLRMKIKAIEEKLKLQFTFGE